MANPRSRPSPLSGMMLQRTIAGPKALSPEIAMTQIAKTVARGLAFSAPRLATRIGRALNRSVAQRYAEQRAQVERTGFGGML